MSCHLIVERGSVKTVYTYILPNHCLHRTVRRMGGPVHHHHHNLHQLMFMHLLDLKDHLEDCDALDISLQEQSDW